MESADIPLQVLSASSKACGVLKLVSQHSSHEIPDVPKTTVEKQKVNNRVYSLIILGLTC